MGAGLNRRRPKISRRFPSQNSGSVSGRRGRVENLNPWKPGQSGNPGGRPKVDVASVLARAVIEENFAEIKAAFSKVLKKGSPYAFQVLSDRAYGKLREVHQIEHGPYHDASDEQIEQRIAELKAKLGVTDITPEPKLLPPADDTKPN